MRTWAAFGTAPPRPCLGKRWISTLTYLRSDALLSDFRFNLMQKLLDWNFLQLEERVVPVCFPCYFFLPFPGCGVCWGLTESCYALWQRKRFFPLLNAGLSFGPNPVEISLKAQKVNTYSLSSAELASDVKDRECWMCGNRTGSYLCGSWMAGNDVSALLPSFLHMNQWVPVDGQQFAYLNWRDSAQTADISSNRYF